MHFCEAETGLLAGFHVDPRNPVVEPAFAMLISPAFAMLISKVSEPAGMALYTRIGDGEFVAPAIDDLTTQGLCLRVDRIAAQRTRGIASTRPTRHDRPEGGIAADKVIGLVIADANSAMMISPLS